MKLVTWSLNHRAAPRQTPSWVAHALQAEGPDLVICCEYVQGPHHSGFVAALDGIGLHHVACSEGVPGHNQILIASRYALESGTLRAPRIHPAVPPNFLHVSVPELELECLGVRIPTGKGFDHLKRDTWNWLLDAASTLTSSRALLAGDLNTDVKDPPGKCGDCLAALERRGWKSCLPQEGASYGGPSGHRRIDHLFVTPAITLMESRFEWDWQARHQARLDIVGSPDHAMLVADLSV